MSNNLDRQSVSDWWKNDRNAKNHLAEYNAQLTEYGSKNKNCYLSYMDNLFNINEVKKLFLFLDEPFDENEYNFIINNNLK